MNKEIKKQIQSFEGTVLGIGLTEEWKREIEKNKKIVKADFLDRKGITEEKIEKTKRKEKTIDIKDLKKLFPKKVDYLFVKQEAIEDDEKTFIPNSLSITKKEILFYGNNKETIKKYALFQTVNILKEEKETFLVKMETANKKPSFKKTGIYYIKETLLHFIDEMANFLSTK